MKFGPKQFSTLLFVAVLLVTAVQRASYSPRLPETLATHFDGAGRPNDWMSKHGFFGFHLALLGTTLRCNLPPRHLWVVISDPTRTGEPSSWST